ncbi:hypothetical protein Tco_0789635 [Tanacetum coccineum]
MTSFDYRLNPIYAIKECSTCGVLYTADFCCSTEGLEDKILVPKPPRNCARCAKCGTPVDGPYCQGCALLRKEFMEGLFTNCVENEFFKDFQDTSESSDDNTNVVNAPREPIVVNQDPGENSSPSPLHIDHCCHECGDSLDGIFCQQCTCKSCGKGAHYGYNCPPKVPIISNPEPCKNQTIDEPLQNLQSLQQQCLFRTCQQCGCNEYDGVCFYCKVGNGTQINVSTPYSSNNSPSVPNPTPQPPTCSYEICGNNAYYGYDCAPQVPFIHNPEPCYNQDFKFPQTLPSFQQQRLGCEKCGGPHETFQCQPMNEDYYHEQNSCYDSNSFGFDQVQPPQYTVNHPIFNSQNELLNSSNKLMEQMTTLCDLVGQAIQKKEEEKRIAEEQAAKDRYWKIPICYDDDEDDTIIITPVLPIEEPVNSLSMGDKHLDTIPETESDEFIKSSVEDLVPIPSESEGIPDKMCDVPLCENTTPLNALNEHSEIVVNSNDDSTSSDDDSYENIDYVDASPPDAEIVSLEVVEIVIPEVGGIDTDILLTIKDDILRENLLNVNLLIANIEALKDNPTPSSDVMTKSSSTSLNLFLEKTNTFVFFKLKLSTLIWKRIVVAVPLLVLIILFRIMKPSMMIILKRLVVAVPLLEFADELAHIISPPEYDHFCFKIEPEMGDFAMDVVEDIFPTREPRVHVPNVLPTHPTLNLDLDLILSSESLFAYVVWIFLPFLTYPVAPPYLLSCGNEDTIFDPGIYVYHSFMPGVSHRSDIRRLFYGRFSFYDPNVDKIKEVKQERIFKSRTKKKAKVKQNQARNGKDKVKGHPSEEYTT